MSRLTVKEAAERLRVKPVTVYRIVSARLVRVERVGPGRRSIRIREEDLAEYESRITTPIVVVTVEAQKSKPTTSAPRRIKLRHLAD